MNVAIGSISLLGQNCAHSEYLLAAEDDRVLGRNLRGKPWRPTRRPKLIAAAWPAYRAAYPPVGG